MNADVLVTGGSGFLGRHLVRAILERGDRVAVLDTVPPPRELASHITWHGGSISNGDAVDRAVRSAREVYHIAGTADLWRREPSEFDSINHRGTHNVLRACARRRTEHVVLASSLVLAQWERLLGADGPMPPERYPCPYARSKREAEVAAEHAARDGLPVASVALPAPIGPGDSTPTPPTRMLVGFLNRRFPAYLEGRLHVADARDLARVMLDARPAGGHPRRTVAGHRVSMGALLQMLQSLSGVDMPTRRIPYPAALAAAYADEFIGRLLPAHMPQACVAGVRLTRSPQPTGDAAAMPAAPDRHRLRPVADSLADQIEWLRSTGAVTPATAPRGRRLAGAGR